MTALEEFVEHLMECPSCSRGGAVAIEGGVITLRAGQFQAYCETPCGVRLVREPVTNEREADRHSDQILRDVKDCVMRNGGTTKREYVQ